MTHEEIIRMAREAGLAHWDDMLQADRFTFALPERLERFAALVAAAEREACVAACREISDAKFVRSDKTGEAFQAGQADGAELCVEALLQRGSSQSVQLPDDSQG